MKASILTIGDEILVGQTIDTNSTYISQQLRLIGISVVEIRTISDQRPAILDALNGLKEVSNVIFITGGLGPTKDDITKKVLCEYFDDQLVRNQEVLNRIADYFSAIKREMLEVHYQQADLPENAKIVLNDLGTASGMWFQKNQLNVISLPGVPYEMKGLTDKIIPQLKELFNIGNFYHRTIHFQGIGESTLANQLSDLEKEAEENNVSIAYLPSIGIVKIRFTGLEEQGDLIDKFIRITKEKFPKNFFGFESETLEEVVGKLLLEKGKTVGTIESCTSGNLAARIVNVPGASAYYEGSLLTYSYDLKSELLDIDKSLIIDKGAVSEEVIREMAMKGRKKLNVDYAIATSGIAGPDGGTPDKPVGTVWIGLASENEVIARVFYFKQNRNRNIELTITYALNMLRRKLLNID